VEESGTLSAKSLVGCAGRLPAGMTCTRHVLYLPVMIDPQQVEGMPNSQQSTTTRTVAVRGWMADVAIFLDPVSWENAPPSAKFHELTQEGWRLFRHLVAK